MVARFVRDEEAAGSSPVTPTRYIFGGLAQLGEHLLHTQGVAGSSPVVSTTTSRQAHGHRVTQSVARLSCDAGAPHSAKSHARLACSVASALATVRCRYQLFAGSAPYGAKGKERSFYIEQFNIAVNFAAQKTPSQFCEGVLRSLRRSKVRFAFSFSQKSSIASPMPLQARVYFGALQKWWRHWRVLL